MNTEVKKEQERYKLLALQHGIKILSKKRLTSKDYRRLEILTKIIFDVNTFQNHILTDRLARSQSCGRVYQDQLFQQKSAESSAD